MSTQPFAPLAPPLPHGWSEHIAPGGQPYYYNNQTKESTYVRPIPAFPVMPIMQSELLKKEKPLVKTAIPGTEWLQVRTTEGNVFFSHKVTKESVWMAPNEIKEALNALEEGEPGKRKVIANEASQAEHDPSMTVQRNKGEVQAIVKRKALEHTPLDEDIVTKKTKVEEEGGNERSESSESEEEEWEREATAQLAAEAEAARIGREQEDKRLQKEAEAAEKPTVLFNIPERVDLSIEEAKALFKALLREKDINPLHPWDMSLPKFVSDPRYVLLPSVSTRREAFDEYCRDRTREIRQSAVKKNQEANPKDEFERLLRNEVKSTRTSWTEFRRTWKKDRSFYNWGRDDREREKRFREYLKELGEKKRSIAQKAEKDFFSLLQERGHAKEGSIWKEVKKQLYGDARYDAVGSSTLREELFNTFLKGNAPKDNLYIPESTSSVLPNSADDEGQEVDEEERQQRRKEKRDRAVNGREQRVRQERERLEADIGRSRNESNREEGEREFKTMLTDAIRDPQMTWDAALPHLKIDPRFHNSPLTSNQQLHLFHSHLEHLRFKHIHSLHGLFEVHAPTLAVQFEELPMTSLFSSLPAVKLGYDDTRLQQEFDKWQRKRTQESRNAFDEMLTENSFVEFWGRLGKIGGEGVDGGVKADEMDEDQGEGGGGKVDMKVLAKNIDIADMEKVLKNDKRYMMFDHIPEQRERWLRDYLSTLSAPKLSVHLPQTV